VAYGGKLMAGGRGELHYVANLPPVLQQVIGRFLEHCV
jgi:hypothetical protein